MTKTYEIVMDAKTKTNPIYRIHICIIGLSRVDAIILAEHSYPDHKIAFILAGYEE